MMIEIIKCHGTGNDFVLIDEISHDYGFTEEQRIAIAREVCDRKGPIGADGILFVLPSEWADGRMRIFNADGSEPEMCGNGLRCVGRYVIEVVGKDVVEIETMKAGYVVRKADEIYQGIATIQITIETVSFDMDTLPMNGSGKEHLFQKIEELSKTLDFSALSISNPHVVSIVNDIDEEELRIVGEKANTTKTVFPRGVNVNFVKILDDQSIYVKTYERGVGLTQSCGTGMTASSIIVCRKDEKRLGSEIHIFNDGGMIKCIVSRDETGKYKVEFIGNASYIYKGKIAFDLDGQQPYQVVEKDMYEKEIQDYDAFLDYARSVLA
ncbi:diaminopimelate epimerase [Anaerosolibacter carboniphilus]|uniref:Diaminopimelate epimerase n=1 Tax=Anaerosolibacter carboniphilus TaxID=1417629 RepID=A0A841KZK2_9FIRM|nr:diaminopimelate epimerase [Anaerosolibacter carboniphilus]MBB6218743.1 diaminopimelate epimerase [Anaerosolibacter carboniphilus]